MVFWQKCFVVGKTLIWEADKIFRGNLDDTVRLKWIPQHTARKWKTVPRTNKRTPVQQWVCSKYINELKHCGIRKFVYGNVRRQQHMMEKGKCKWDCMRTSSTSLSLSLGSPFPTSYSPTHPILRGECATLCCIINLMLLALNKCLICNTIQW